MRKSDSPILEVMDRDECLRCLQSAPVGRIAVVVHGLARILPVNFVVHYESIVVRTVEGTKLDAANSGAIVAFEADHYEDDGSSGWSVMLQGEVTEVTGASALSLLRSLPLKAWAFGEAADRFIQIEILRMTGRKFAGRR